MKHDRQGELLVLAVVVLMISVVALHAGAAQVPRDKGKEAGDSAKAPTDSDVPPAAEALREQAEAFDRELIRRIRDREEADRREQARLETWQPFRRVLFRWFTCLSRHARNSGGRVEHLVGNLFWTCYQDWETKVLSLKEFAGDKSEADLQLSPLEKALWDALRVDIARLPCFKRTDLTPEERMDLCQQALSDRLEPHQEDVVKRLREWLDRAYKERFAPERERAERIRVRALHLFNFLTQDVQEANHLSFQSSALSPFRRLSVSTVKKLERSDAYIAMPVDGDERLRDLSEAEAALYAYLREAVKANPVFADLDNNVSLQQEFEAYRAYVATGRAEPERQAYERAVKALAKQAGQPLSVP